MALKEKSEIDQLLEEFRKIGRDSAYNPESEDKVATDIPINSDDEYRKDYSLTLYAHWYALMQELSPRPAPVTHSQPVQVGPQICSFCRKNGESASFYRSHNLRDDSNKMCCPILRRYVCPICQATGDDAHTVKYCPSNKDPQSIPLITRLKGLRNSMGKKRGKENY